MKIPVFAHLWALVLACLLAPLAGCGGHGTPSAPKSEPLVVGGGSPKATESASSAQDEDGPIPVLKDDAVRGHRGAPVTVVVFSDFQCPFCSRHEATLARVREAYGDDTIRVVFKNNPLAFHAHARLASEVGQGVLALAGQDAFWSYHAKVFSQQRDLSEESIRAAAIAAGAPDQALAEGLRAKRWSSKIDADIELGSRIGVKGTPISFVNGIAIEGAQPFDRFKDVIDAELGKAKALVENGAPRDTVSARLTAANIKNPPKTEETDADDDPPAKDKVVHKLPAGTGPVRGPATAPVTIVEFSDFQCPYCKRAHEVLARIRREYGDKVRIVWRDMPLGFHPRAEPAAQLARAARAQKGDAGFWDVHDLLFAAQPALDDADLERIAREAKLDVAKAMAAVRAHTFKKAIDDDMAVAADFEAAGTPHFFVNGRRFVGAQPFEKWKPLLDEEIAKAEGLLKSGTSRAGLYDALVKDGKGPSEPERKTIAPAPANAPFRGAANAKVVIHEVSDFQCPFCKRGDATIEELLKAYPGKIKVIWRDKPLPMHSDAPLAAEAAREAYAQKGNDGFSKMRALLFQNQQALKRADLEGYAKTLGLDLRRFSVALDNHTHKAAVDADDKATTDAGVSGTPAFFIGPYYLSGAQPIEKFKKLVDRILDGSAAAAPAPVAPVAAPTAPGLVTKDTVVGTGPEAKSGNKVRVHYVGTLVDGTEFDSSRKRGQPFSFELGRGHVIRGWEQGIVGMRVGGTRKLTIPPDLAYGDRGVGSIPPKSTLLFEVELLAIE